MFDCFGFIAKDSKTKAIYHPNLNNSKYLVNIDHESHNIEGDNFNISFLTHDRQMDNYSNNDTHIYMLGNIYSNKEYYNDSGIKPSRLYREDIYNMYLKHGEHAVDFIKGIFILLIFDEKIHKYYLVNSKYGLLDLYYIEFDNKLYFSTSIEAIIENVNLNFSLNKNAILERLIFNYTLGDETIFQKIKSIPTASFLKYDLRNYEIKKYYNVKKLLNIKNKIGWDELNNNSTAKFNESVDLLVKGRRKVCSAITGGFDSRTILSRLIKKKTNVLYYSWGMRNSQEIKIPIKISKKIDMKYMPIYLDDDFIRKHDYFSNQVLFWSDGRAPISRANHTYGYSILSKHNRFVITGLFGSELLRPANAFGTIYNSNFIDILYAKDKKQKIEEILKKEKSNGYLHSNFIENIKEGFIDKVFGYFENLTEDLDEEYKQLYYLFLNEGFRKYFGHEIHGCRMYADITSPYIDDDFVEFILKTKIPELNKQAFKRDKDSLYKGQSFYLPIIQNNYPKLMKIRTNRFYDPNALISKFYPFSILPGYLFGKIRKIIIKNDTFNSQKWNKQNYLDDVDILKNSDDIFQDITGKEDYNNYDKIFSLKKWIYTVANKE